MILAQYFKPLPISKYYKKGYISNLFVMKKYRQKGIGKKLVQKAEEWLRKNGAHHATLEIHVDNKSALNFYHGLGFKDYTMKLSKKV